MNPTIPTQRKLQVRPWPLVIGVFLSLVTARVLFDDVWHGAEISTGHILSLAAIVVALSAGHFAIPQLRSRAIISGVMLGLLFVSATAYVVISSGARNAEQATAKAARAADVNTRRAHEAKLLGQAEDMLDDANKRLDRDCVRGNRGKGHCDGIRATITTYAAAVRGHKAVIADLGPEQQPDAGYAHAARVLAAVPYVTTSADAIEARLSLLLPFLVVLICELGTITFLHMAFGHIDVPVALNTVTEAEMAALRRSFMGGGPTPVPPRPPRGGRPMLVATNAEPAVLAASKRFDPLITELVERGPAASQQELVERTGLSKSEISKQKKDNAHLLDVARNGRCYRLALREDWQAIAAAG